MTNRSVQLQLGIGACVAAIFLVLVAIPTWVSAPSNISNIILSPLFWPYTLGTITALVGLALIAAGFQEPETDEPLNEPIEDPQNAWLRLVGAAIIMVATMLLLPRLGMVWTCMLCFVAMAFLYRTRHPVVAVISAVIVPLVLYAFFAHVAGVAIPQGHFVRLP